MRYIGILMMAGALAAGGFWAADQWKEKLELLLLFRQMMFYLKGQILYANATLPEALREVGGRYAEGRSGFLKEPGAFFLRVRLHLTVHVFPICIQVPTPPLYIRVLLG